MADYIGSPYFDACVAIVNCVGGHAGEADFGTSTLGAGGPDAIHV